MSEDDPITLWINTLKDGNESVAENLWNAYFQKLVRLARKEMHGFDQGGYDEEDAALSAFHSFFRAVRRNQFPDLENRENLWRLLMVLTLRKVRKRQRHNLARKRGGGQKAVSASEKWEANELEQIMGSEPTPELAAEFAEEYCRLLDSLGDENLRKVAVWKMEGYTNDEIAEKLSCVRRTVIRRLNLIRDLWQATESTL